MENQIQVEKKTFLKRKVMGIPMILFMILVVGVVAAIVVIIIIS